MNAFFLIMGLGTPEMIVIAVVGLLLFGRRLPEVGRTLGKSFLEFKSGMQNLQAEFKEVDRMTDTAARQKREQRDAIAPPADTYHRSDDSTDVTDEADSDDAYHADDSEEHLRFADAEAADNEKSLDDAAESQDGKD